MSIREPDGLIEHMTQAFRFVVPAVLGAFVIYVLARMSPVLEEAAPLLGVVAPPLRKDGCSAGQYPNRTTREFGAPARSVTGPGRLTGSSSGR